MAIGKSYSTLTRLLVIKNMLAQSAEYLKTTITEKTPAGREYRERNNHRKERKNQDKHLLWPPCTEKAL